MTTTGDKKVKIYNKFLGTQIANSDRYLIDLGDDKFRTIQTDMFKVLLENGDVWLVHKENIVEIT